jgi:D-alanine-D-alanine ligase
VRTAHLDITVLAGGPSDEREVSLASGQCVAGALASRGHRVSMRDVNPSDLSALERPADIIFVALHGAFGEDGAVQSMLEQRGIPFTGSGAAASALAMNKVLAKARFSERGLPTPRYEVVRAGRLGDVVERWRLPAVIKPISSGSSVDTYIIRDETTLARTLGDVVRKHGEALLEECIDGPEITIGVLGDCALPPIQIRTKRPFYDYQAKYIDDDTEYLFDIELPARVLGAMQAMSLRAADALGCRDMCRVDWMVDRVTHEPYILEINTIPGFTTHSLLPKAAAQAGISFADLCQRIVELALNRGAQAG